MITTYESIHAGFSADGFAGGIRRRLLAGTGSFRMERGRGRCLDGTLLGPSSSSPKASKDAKAQLFGRLDFLHIVAALTREKNLLERQWNARRRSRHCYKLCVVLVVREEKRDRDVGFRQKLLLTMVQIHQHQKRKQHPKAQ